MARTLSSQAVFHQLTGVFRLDDTATTGTTVATSAKGDKTISGTAGDGANFPAGSILRIGANGSTAEVCEVFSVAVDVLTLQLPLARAVASGATFTLLTQIDLGATDENGVNLESTQGETPVIAGTQKNTYLFINQNIEEQLTFALRDFDPENLAASLGMDETSAAIVDAKGVTLPIDSDAVSEGNKPWLFEGLLENAKVVKAFVFSAKVASLNQTIQLVEGAATVIPFTLRSNGNRSFQII